MSDDKWIMRGRALDDPRRISGCRGLIDRVNEIGFLPLFRGGIEGFSVEEQTYPGHWWSGDARRDPWEWRVEAARGGEVAYGKFFGGKSGFVSLEWFPAFANYRRDGYDFDARWDDGLANYRCKKIMDCFERQHEYAGYMLKGAAGFGKDGEKNFSGMLTLLQMQTYLVISDFRFKLNKRGEPYGMPVSVYTMPETLWGYDMVSSGYSEEPEESREKISEHIKKLFPNAEKAQIMKILK